MNRMRLDGARIKHQVDEKGVLITFEDFYDGEVTKRAKVHIDDYQLYELIDAIKAVRTRRAERWAMIDRTLKGAAE